MPEGRVTTTPNYIKQDVADWTKLKHEHPKAAVRSLRSGEHVLRIAYWGKQSNGHHANSQLISILHPKSEVNPCNIKDKLIRNLKCPVCGAVNPVYGMRVRCQGCQSKLRVVRVRK